MTGEFPRPRTELGVFALRRLAETDLQALMSLRHLAHNRALLGFPVADGGAWQEFLRDIQSQLWGMPMLAVARGNPAGMMCTISGNPTSLSARLLVLFSEPGEAITPLALYIRHLFWGSPLQRLYFSCPSTPPTGSYLQVLTSVGFQVEGVLPSYALIADERRDVTVMGILREEFVTWAPTHDERLRL